MTSNQNSVFVAVLIVAITIIVFTIFILIPFLNYINRSRLEVLQLFLDISENKGKNPKRLRRTGWISRMQSAEAARGTYKAR